MFSMHCYCGLWAYYSLVYVYAVNTIQQDIAHEISLAGEKPEVMKSRWSRFRRQYISWKQHSCSKNKMNEPKATCTNSDELVMRFMALFSWVHVCMCVCACVCVCVCVGEWNRQHNTNRKQKYQLSFKTLFPTPDCYPKLICSLSTRFQSTYSFEFQNRLWYLSIQPITYAANTIMRMQRKMYGDDEKFGGHELL